jgi:hypothetical protein
MNTCPNCGKVAGLHSSILQGCMCQYSMQAQPHQEQKLIGTVGDLFDDKVIAHRKLDRDLLVYTKENAWAGKT